MVWDHVKKQKEIALSAINRPRPYRPLKVVPHDPKRNPLSVKAIGGWITTEIFLLGKTPEYMELLLGFDHRPGMEYLKTGVDVFEFKREILLDDFSVGGYTYLPAGRPWDGIDFHWPPGTGAPQWRLEVAVPCAYIKTIPRGVAFV